MDIASRFRRARPIAQIVAFPVPSWALSGSSKIVSTLTERDLRGLNARVVAALPKMAKAAQDRKLEAAFEKHRIETETHVSRLE